MSAAWHGGLSGGEEFVNDPALLTAIHSSMDFWFENDFQDLSCLDNGGNPPCPCGTPGFWNTNWFSNVRFLSFANFIPVSTRRRVDYFDSKFGGAKLSADS